MISSMRFMRTTGVVFGLELAGGWIFLIRRVGSFFAFTHPPGKPSIIRQFKSRQFSKTPLATVSCGLGPGVTALSKLTSIQTRLNISETRGIRLLSLTKMFGSFNIQRLNQMCFGLVQKAEVSQSSMCERVPSLPTHTNPAMTGASAITTFAACCRTGRETVGLVQAGEVCAGLIPPEKNLSPIVMTQKTLMVCRTTIFFHSWRTNRESVGLGHGPG